MDPQRQREIASLGGLAATAKGTKHAWNSETARAAGRKGGLARRNKIAREEGEPLPTRS